MARLSIGLPERLLRLRMSANGQGFVEYIFIIGLVALGLTAALIAFQGQISTAMSTIGAGV